MTGSSWWTKRQEDVTITTAPPEPHPGPCQSPPPPTRSRSSARYHADISLLSLWFNDNQAKLEKLIESISLQPPLPEEDYPVDGPGDSDAVFTTVQHTHTHTNPLSSTPLSLALLHCCQEHVAATPTAPVDVKEAKRRQQEVLHAQAGARGQDSVVVSA